MIAVVLKKLLKDALNSPDSISQNPSQKGSGSRVEMPYGYEELLGPSIWLGF